MPWIPVLCTGWQRSCCRNSDVVCVSVSGTRGWALQKRINRSICRPGSGLGSAKATTHYLVRGSRSSNRKWNFWKKNNVGFSPHTVYQRSDWRAAEADGCHIKFSAMKHPPPAMWPLVKILQAPVVCYSPLTVQSISSSSPGQSSVPSHFWEMWRQGASWPRHW